MEKLSRSGSRQHTPSKSEENKGSARRLFSLNRRAKDQEQATGQESGDIEYDLSRAQSILTPLFP
jgi:hypothetical protein